MTKPADPHKPLRDDVSMLGEMLGDTPGLLAEFKTQVDQLEKDIQGAP